MPIDRPYKKQIILFPSPSGEGARRADEVKQIILFPSPSGECTRRADEVNKLKKLQS